MLALAKHWHVRQADAIIDSVLGAMQMFGTVAKAGGVRKANINEIGNDIARRMARLR